MDPVLDYAPVPKRVLWRNYPRFFWLLSLRAAPAPLLVILFFIAMSHMRSLKVGNASSDTVWYYVLKWDWSKVYIVSDEGDTVVCAISGVDSHHYMRVRKVALDSQAQESVRRYLDDLTLFLEGYIKEGLPVESEWRDRLSLLAGQDLGDSSMLWYDWISTTGLKTTFPQATLSALRDARTAPAPPYYVTEYDQNYRYYWRYHWRTALWMAFCALAAAAWAYLQKYLKLPPLREA